MPEQLPGANVLAVLMQAPADIVGLAARQVTEVVDTFGVGVERLGVELAVPPEITGMPMFPPLPGMAPAGAPSAAPAAAPAVGIQGRAATRRGLRPKLIV